MNKTELIAAVAEKTELTKKDSEKAVNAVIEAISESLEQGRKVVLVGFGTFEVRNRAERMGRNPAPKRLLKFLLLKPLLSKLVKTSKNASTSRGSAP